MSEKNENDKAEDQPSAVVENKYDKERLEMIAKRARDTGTLVMNFETRNRPSQREIELMVQKSKDRDTGSETS